MALGRRGGERQGELWVAADELARSAGHVFYQRLNDVLAGADFDPFVEDLCEPYYAAAGRPGIPPGVYFRMLLVGCFEGIDSQRGIAWRCGDSLSLRDFLGIPLTERTPDHSSLTRIADRLPAEVYHRVFTFVLDLVDALGMLHGRTVAVDSTTLEASAAMKSIVRRDTGEDWREYLTRLMREEGEIDEDDQPTDEELRRFDKWRAKARKKKVSNAEWKSPTDEDARILRLKNGRTHLGYKAEHVVDVETEVILSARVLHGTDSDTQTLVDAVTDARQNLEQANCEAVIEEVTADKGYHSNDTLAECQGQDLRTYIPEPKSPHGRRWTGKPDEVKRAALNNRRRTRRAKGRSLQRKRNGKVERSFAHVCESGGMRRCRLRGLAKNTRRYILAAAAHNLSLVMRKLFGSGQPRNLQSGLAATFAAFCAVPPTLLRPRWPWIAGKAHQLSRNSQFGQFTAPGCPIIPGRRNVVYSTGC